MNTLKRKTYMRIETGGKVFMIIILLILFLCGAAAGTVLLLNHQQSETEQAFVHELGLTKLVQISEDVTMNVAVKGLGSKHKLVTLAGLGMNDYGVYIDYITQSLQTENQLIIIDRPGAGFSKDTEVERTASTIVEEYRTALMKQAISAPYVLVANEIGAIYATMWQNLYPSEVEGIIYIDPNPIDFESAPYIGLKVPENATLLNLGGKLGVQRFMYDKLYTPESVRIPSNYNTAAHYFNINNMYTTAYLNEIDMAKKNFENAFGAIQSTDIPKMYINCSYAFETEQEAMTYIDYVNSQARQVGQEKVYEDTYGSASLLVSNSQAMSAKINSYAQQLGNCHLVQMPGGANIFEQDYGAVKSAITDFIAYLDGEVATLQTRYVDEILVEWQNQQTQNTENENTEDVPAEVESES